MAEDDIVSVVNANEHECGQIPGDSGQQEGLECYNPWGHKESDMI